MATSVLIALGGNMGDVRSTGAAALTELNQIPGLKLCCVSRWYSTEPVGCEGRFLNAAAVLESELIPTQLLDELHVIEARHGRVRTATWTPRPLDLDLVLYGTWRMQSPRLVIPHPAAWYRRFVLDPVCEIAGDWVHPDAKVSLSSLRTRLMTRPICIHWAGDQAWREIIEHPTLRDYERILELASADESLVSFTRYATGGQQIQIPSEIDEARDIVVNTLTAILDEPEPVI